MAADDTQATERALLLVLVNAGYTAPSVAAAISADDFGMLRPEGRFSVQLQPPEDDGTSGTDDDPPTGAAPVGGC